MAKVLRSSGGIYFGLAMEETALGEAIAVQFGIAAHEILVERLDDRRNAAV
jgi:hypothetical protein